MTRFLLPARSVHGVAAACDYLERRLAPDDRVTALAVREPGADPRDVDDALNVASVRLSGRVTVETVERAGEPAATILERAAADADEVVVGIVPDVGLDETVRAVAVGAPVPVVVVPGPGGPPGAAVTEG